MNNKDHSVIPPDLWERIERAGMRVGAKVQVGVSRREGTIATPSIWQYVFVDGVGEPITPRRAVALLNVWSIPAEELPRVVGYIDFAGNTHDFDQADRARCWLRDMMGYVPTESTDALSTCYGVLRHLALLRLEEE